MFHLEQLLCSVKITAILFYDCKVWFDWLDITGRQLAMQNAFSFGVFLISIRPFTERVLLSADGELLSEKERKK